MNVLPSYKHANKKTFMDNIDINGDIYKGGHHHHK